jgi:hypothetical protein
MKRPISSKNVHSDWSPVFIRNPKTGQNPSVHKGFGGDEVAASRRMFPKEFSGLYL